MEIQGLVMQYGNSDLGQHGTKPLPEAEQFHKICSWT